MIYSYERPKDDCGAVIYYPDFFRLPKYILVSTQNINRSSTQNIIRSSTQNIIRSSTQNIIRSSTQNIIRSSNGYCMLKEHQSKCDEIYAKD
jgi:hypothetical protein